MPKKDKKTKDIIGEKTDYIATVRNIIISLTDNSVIMFILLSLIGIVACLCTKYDISWDLANYHYYNPYAMLHNRVGYDISPASVQTYFNPLIDIPTYLMIEYFNDNLNILYAYQGIWFGLLLFAVYKISLLFIEKDNLSRVIQIGLILVLAASGQAVMLQLGSTTNEIQVSAAILGVIYFLIKYVKYPEQQSSYKYLFLGTVMGTILGLKPTVVYLCLASGISLIMCFRYLKKPLKFILLFALGGVLGYLLTSGWWMYKLWSLYENPFFPFGNEIFQSPYFDNLNYAGTIFVPPLSKMFIFPYIWHYGKYRTIESNFTDIHGTAYYTVGVLFLLYLLISPQRMKNFFEKKRLWGFYLVLMTTGYILWLQIFSVYRYLIVIEVLSAIFLIKIMFSLQPKKDIIFALYWAMCITFLYVMISNIKAVRPWDEFKNANQKISVEDVSIPENTLIKAYGLPVSFVIPIWSKQNEVRVLGYSQYTLEPMAGTDFADRGKFKQIKEEIVRKHQGPIIVLYAKLPMISVMDKVLRKNIAADIKDKVCRPLKNSLYGGLEICVSPELSETVFKKQNKS